MLQFDHVNHTYAPRRSARIAVLQDFSFQVADSECVALLGRSGSGKSTVLRLAAGMLVPDAGDVLVQGTRISSLGEAERAAFRLAHVAQVHQDFKLLAGLDALDNVALPERLRGAELRTARELAKEALTRVGLAGRLSHRPGELSGGEQQRVALARALLGAPRLVLADEPTGSLDATQREEILDLLFEIFPDTAMVIVTHDPAVAARAARVERIVA